MRMESYDRLLDRFCVPQETIDGGLRQYAIRPDSRAAVAAALGVGGIKFLWDTPFINPWMGAGAFIRYVIEHPEQFAGKTLVDVGAGSGLLVERI